MTAVQGELKRIEKANNGVLRPHDVVAFARNKKTALHSQFEWDNRKAGDEYRLWQARQVIISVKIMPHPDAGIVTRAYVSMKDDRAAPRGGYRSVVTILGDKERRAQLLEEAMDELEHFKQKYKALKELAPIFAAMRSVGRKRRTG